MAEKDNTFQNTVEALFRGMDSFITTKTVVGEAIHIDDTMCTGCGLCDSLCKFGAIELVKEGDR